ncbi:DUF2752 domain-containing protein [Flavobacterium beibuense]|uniref:Membrane protein n=1 Tax=Flavobacterium beibuense TaxID=657326 RepID=A0A444WAT8_9FLAO|nr:DUF2752 domain-containing protein [Flavobacterium beibuense]RYJ42928.1 Membrane protein [Flavobacterium beibuense]
MTRNRLYLILVTVFTAGYFYTAWSILHIHQNNNLTFCPVKNITGIACPSCGSTRSIIEISKGNFYDALLLNPFGYIIAAGLLVLPLWLLYDILFKKDSLYKSYLRFEKTLRIKWVAIILILLTIANWGWNICKGL